MSEERTLVQQAGQLFQVHPWHGIPTWAEPGRVLNAFIELVPTDGLKYELDRKTGHLRVDRPQRFSNRCPTLYGFFPRTLGGAAVAARSVERTGRAGLLGDGDPLDVCVLFGRTIRRGAFLAHVRPVGGVRTIDGETADDKILAVLDADPAFGAASEVGDLPGGLLERLRHYFETYKQPPDAMTPRVAVAETFGRAEAIEVIRRAEADYVSAFPSAL